MKQPKTLEEAVQLLYDEQPLNGADLRNALYLWWTPALAQKALSEDPEYPQEMPALVKWFNERNISHADDMSSTIEAVLKAKATGEPFDFDEHIKIYFKHWEDTGFRDGMENIQNVQQ